jgi:2-succinyl-5-enolpyruvyl-6-hydroxy-3-cyclohexene-1-carboxylate synthase
VTDTAQLNREQALLIAQTAIEHGAVNAVLSPGARNTPLVLALHDLREAGWPIALHSVLDERSAGFFALGLSRISGTPTLLSCTSGSAGANYFPAIVEASEGRVPLIVVTADRPEELQDCGAPQTMNQKELFGAHVRAFLNLGTPDPKADGGAARTALTEAMARTTGHHPGPVHINAMFRKPLWASGATVPDPHAQQTRAPAALATPLDDDIDAAIAQLNGRRGAIVAGPDPCGSIKHSSLIELGEQLGWPVLADPVSTVRNHRSPAVVRHHDGMLRCESFRNRAQPEVLLSVGGTPSSRPVQELIARTPTVRIDPVGCRWDPWQSVTHSFAFRIDHLIERLKSLPTHKDDDWIGIWTRGDQAAEQALASLPHDPLWEGAIAATLIPMLPPHSLLRLASSMPIRDADSFGLCADKTISVTSNRGVNGIDGLVATTLGEATAHRQTTVVLSGDLSFLHDSGSLSTVPHPKVPVVLLVLDNNGGAIFSYLPMANHPTGFETWFTTPHSADIGAVAKGHGVPVHQPTTMAELQSAWSTSLNHPGVTVIHVRIDPDQSARAHTDAWTTISRAVEATL